MLGGIRKPTRELHTQNEKELIRPPVDLSLFKGQGRIETYIVFELIEIVNIKTFLFGNIYDGKTIMCIEVFSS